MEIIMFIIFIVTNLFIILCMQFAYTHAYKYENGMYLNVHIPSSPLRYALLFLLTLPFLFWCILSGCLHISLELFIFQTAPTGKCML